MATTEIKRAKELETAEARIQEAIDRARDHFAIVGAQLESIRDGKLFPDATFEAYCSRRWGFSRSYAHRLISGAEVFGNLEDAEGGPPETERQAREIAKASDDPEDQKEVWTTAQAIAGDSQPTAPVIVQAAEIVQTGRPVNHESIEVDAAIDALSKATGRLVKIGQAVQVAMNAKVAACPAMSSRRIKFENLLKGTAGQVEILQEWVNDLAAKWQSTKKQVDE
jgi:predicted house-cleaning NTP pyrophosphatase (Maf/HAM1 superfamily)